MELTLSQQDALTELVNIGYGRAAGALSELTGHRVTLEVPRISMHPIEDVPLVLGREITGDVASVNQGFFGPIAGNALLLLDEKSAMILSRLLSDGDTLQGSFDASARETITEVGNILLNACLSVFGNLLQTRVSFAVPLLQVGDIDHILASMKADSAEVQFGLMIHMHFHLRASNVTGYLIIILGIASLDRMLREVDNWEMQQSS